MTIIKLSPSSKKRYIEKYGICIDYFEDIDVIQWWKYVYYGSPNGNIIKHIPKEFYKDKNNIIRVCKYVLEEEIGYKTRDELSLINCKLMQQYKITFSSTPEINFSPFKLLSFCFPEYNFKQYELSDVGNGFWEDDNNKIEALDWYLQKYNYTYEDILNGKVNRKVPIVNTLCIIYFKNILSLWIWYFGTKNIIISEKDFKLNTNGSLTDINYVINLIREYAEVTCKDSILPYIKNNIDIGQWVNNNFTHNHIVEYRLNHSRSFPKDIYSLLTMAYPEIKRNNLFFEWENGYCKKLSEKEYCIKSLRELVFYRLKLKDESDIPKYLTFQYLKNTQFDKFIAICQREYSTADFYYFACDAFPEYKDVWKREDFGSLNIAKDGEKLNSHEELYIYELIKFDMEINIKPMGYKRSGKYTYNPDNQDNKYCPDFVIENILDKPIIIEYFGMTNCDRYCPSSDYDGKTVRKNIYYNSLDSIYYIDLYPIDLKNNFQGVKEKLTQLLQSNPNYHKEIA